MTELKQLVQATRFSRRSLRSHSHSWQRGHWDTPQVLHGHQRDLPR
jgi:hypothetical protein